MNETVEEQLARITIERDELREKFKEALEEIDILQKNLAMNASLNALQQEEILKSTPIYYITKESQQSVEESSLKEEIIH